MVPLVNKHWGCMYGVFDRHTCRKPCSPRAARLNGPDMQMFTNGRLSALSCYGRSLVLGLEVF
jgi:hypothetical protein